MRGPQQFKIGLQAFAVGKADPAQPRKVKPRRQSHQLGNGGGRFGRTLEPRTGQRQNDKGKGEISIAFDRLVRQRQRLFGMPGQQMSKGAGQSGVVAERLERA